MAIFNSYVSSPEGKLLQIYKLNMHVQDPCVDDEDVNIHMVHIHE